MAVIPNLFDEKTSGVIPNLFDEEIPSGVIPNLFEPEPIQEAPFSMFKETMRNLPSAMGETLLQAPIQTLVETARMISEPLEAGKLGAIKTAYDTISGLVEFSRKHFKPIRERVEGIEVEGVAIKDMPKISPEIDEFISGLSQKAKQRFLQSNYVKQKEKIMKEHPIATGVGGVGADIGLLMAISYATQGKGTSPLIIKLATKYPKIALTLQSMARSGKVLGIHGFVRELSKTKDLPKAVKAGVGSGSFGALVFGIGGGIENPIVRGLLQTASAHTLDKISSLRAKHERGEKITIKDFFMPSLQTIFIAALSAISAPMHQRAIKAQKFGYIEKGMKEIQKKGYEVPSEVTVKKGAFKLGKMFQFWAKAKNLSPKTARLETKYEQEFRFWSNKQAKYPSANKALETIKPEQSYKVSPIDKNVATMTGKGIADEVSKGTVFKEIAPIKPTVKAPVGKIVTDPAKVQEIKNSIAGGQLILKAGTSHGRKLSKDELWSVRKSVEKSMAKIGEGRIATKGYAVEDVTPAGYAPAKPTPEVKGLGALKYESVDIKELKPKPLLSKFLPRDDEAMMTKQGEYTNGQWLLKSEFTPEKLKLRMEIGAKVSKHPDAKSAWNLVEKELESVGDIDGYVTTEMGKQIYIFKLKNGNNVAIQKPFYDYLQKHIPAFNLKASKNTLPISIFSGNKEAGLVMPMKIDTDTTKEIKWITGKATAKVEKVSLEKYIKNKGFNPEELPIDVKNWTDTELKKYPITKEVLNYRKEYPALAKKITKPTLTPTKALKQATEHTIPAKSLKIGDMFLHPSGEVYKVIPTPKDAPSNRIYIQDGKKRVLAKSDDIHLKGAVNDPALVGKAGMKIHGEEWTEGFADIEKAKVKKVTVMENIRKTKGIEQNEKDVAVAYEQQKELWFQKKDMRVFKTKTEKSRLQTELRTATGEKKYTEKVKDYDKAIQLYIDTQRNPEHLAKYYNKLSPEQKKIADIAQDLPDNIRNVADKISDSYRKIGLEAQESDVIKNVLDNYVNRTWNLSEKQRVEIFRKFGTTTRHAKSRVFDTILQGWAKGYNLKVEGATNNLQILKEEMIKTIEDKRFLKALQKLKTIDGESLLTTAHVEGYIKVEHPNFKIWKWAGDAKKGKTYGRNFFIDEQDNLFERRELYAPKAQAQNINNILGVSKLKDIYGVKALTKYNAIIKAWILQSSFFHHLAFMRSYMFGTNHKRWSEMSPRQAYKQGLKAVEEENPIVLLGIKNGLTLGLKQDWNEELLQEKTVIGEILDKTKVTREIKDKILGLRQAQADFLFGKFGAGLKAKSFMIEYRNLTKKHPEKSADEIAKMVANLINDDFGGLHLQRLGRNPTIQHVFRLFALAPDWTESNVRSMVKAFKGGSKAETTFYRRFWAGILTKGILITVFANMLLNPDDPWGSYKRGWREGKLRWLDVDITNLYRLLRGKSESRKYFSVYGHFKDPIKFITHPIRSAHHKGSVVYKFFHEALSGVDWAGRRFTTTPELLGVDKEKGVYKTTRRGIYKKGDPKWGKLKGKTVTWDFKGRGSLSYSQLPSFILNQLKGWQPIQIQNLLSWLAGEMEGFDAILKSGGFRVSTTYTKEPQKQKPFLLGGG